VDRITVVCHDAGGAEILSSWILKTHHMCNVVTAGPAVKIFDRKCISSEKLSLTEAINKSDWVLCGTGSSGFELQAIKLGRQQGKRTVAFLDHWCNYKERFQHDDGSFSFPDEIWVGDKDALSIAKKDFPNIPIILHTNPYFEDLYNTISKTRPRKSSTKKISILYVCDPIQDFTLKYFGDKLFWGYTEESALKYFFKNITFLNLEIGFIKIRPHPSEKPDKYLWAKALAPELVRFGGDKTLIEEIIDADLVVGCDSMAMVVGLIAGKRVISSIPPGGHPLRIPQAGIEKLYELI